MGRQWGPITVFLADDSAIIRAGVSAMLQRDPDVEVVGVAEDYDTLVAGAARRPTPTSIVSDIRMPPHFESEGIDACKEIRKRHPGTGVVILSQYDDPDYAVALLAEGSAGYAYLLKDRIAEGDQLARAIREVATGGSMLDPVIVSALINPVRRTGGLSTDDDELLEMVASGRTIKAIAGDAEHHAGGRRRPGGAAVRPPRRGGVERAGRRTRPAAPPAPGDRRTRGAGREPEPAAADRRRRSAARRRAGRSARPRRLDVTVVMSDIRGYTTIAEHADPTVLAQQLNRHRAEMNRAILSEGGTVMQYVGDAVMAVFGAPVATDRPRRPRARRRPGDAPRPGRRERGVDRRGPHAVRARHRAQHRHGRGGAARQRGAGRVHTRRRRREPVPAPPAVRRARRDRAQRGDLGRAHRATRPCSSSSSPNSSRAATRPVVPYRLPRPDRPDRPLNRQGAPT